jgi:formate--tetrahydrofolate ligase
VSFNKFKHDTQEEIDFLTHFCEKEGVVFAINNGFTKGGEGAADLAKKVLSVIENNPSKDINFTYDLEDHIKTKIEKIATKIYRAGEVVYNGAAFAKLKQFEANGWGHLPVCIAKTQYSFTDDEKRINAPEGFVINIRDLVINAGAGFIVAVAGEIMRMPGLPKDPQAMHIKLVNGNIEGLS